MTTDKHGRETVTMVPMSQRRSFMAVWFNPKVPALSKAAVQLLGMHATSCAPERNWSKLGLMYAKNKSKLNREKAQKIILLGEHHGEGDSIEPEMISLARQAHQHVVSAHTRARCLL